MKHKTQITT